MSVAAAARLAGKVLPESGWNLARGLARPLAANANLYVSPMPRQAFLSALEDTPGALPIRDAGHPQVTLDDSIPGEPACYFDEIPARLRPNCSPEDAYSGHTRFLLLFELFVHPLANQDKIFIF